MTSKGAGCGTDGLFILDPMTPAQMRDRGVGPHARGAHATTQTMDEAAARDFECQTDSAAARAVAAQSPEDLSVSRAALEATAGGAIASAASAALARRRAAAQRATEVARARAICNTRRSDAVRRLSRARRARARAPARAGREPARRRLRRGHRAGGRATEAARLSGPAREPHLELPRPVRRRAHRRARRDGGGVWLRRRGLGATSLLVAYGPRAGARRGRAARGQILVWDLAAPCPR